MNTFVPGDRLMFFVWKANLAREEFECVGAFSKEEDAKAFILDLQASPQNLNVNMSQMTWSYARDLIVRTHLAGLSEKLLDLFVPLKSEDNGCQTKDSQSADMKMPAS